VIAHIFILAEEDITKGELPVNPGLPLAIDFLAQRQEEKVARERTGRD
jgi:hypothetical protein